MQQINLYLPELRPRKEWVTAPNALLALGGLCVLVLSLWLLDRATIAEKKERVAELEARSEALQTELEALKNRPKTSNKVELERQLARAQAAIDNRKGLLAVVNSESFGNQRGFSDKLYSLSHHVRASMALELFAFDNGGVDVRLAGQSSDVEQIPSFIGDLKSDGAFDASHFGQLSIRREGPRLSFRLNGRTDNPSSLKFDLEAMN